MLSAEDLLRGVIEWYSYGNLKVHDLVGEGGNAVIEAEAVFALCSRSEDIISLLLLFPAEEYALLSRLLVWSVDRVVDWKGNGISNSAPSSHLISSFSIDIPPNVLSNSPPLCTAK